MTTNDIFTLAHAIFKGEITLGYVVSTYGYNVAEQVYTFDLRTALYNQKDWTRKIR